MFNNVKFICYVLEPKHTSGRHIWFFLQDQTMKLQSLCRVKQSSLQSQLDPPHTCMSRATPARVHLDGLSRVFRLKVQT